MRKIIGFFILFLTLIAASVTTYIYFGNISFSLKKIIPRFNFQTELRSPFVSSPSEEVLPLEKYSIPNLKNYNFQSSEIILTELVNETDDYSTYLFTFQTMGKNMTGTANIPQVAKSNLDKFPVIVLVRGYAAPDQYYPGFGTRNAADVLAKNGYVTLAPDFFGFGNSDSEPEDSWEARFIKPINVIELIKTIQENSTISINTSSEKELLVNDISFFLDPVKIGIWAHSNGGQITLSCLQILSEPIPSTLWAPVTAPFPYSILFFTRTSDDEGKQTRAWLAMFEKDYDAFEFSITQHLQYLTGPIQIHHGGQDTESLQIWSDAFVSKLAQENKRRLEVKESNQTQEENKTSNKLEEIIVNYHTYPTADHNLQPTNNWQQAIQRDLDFFSTHL
jgi:hypothetical protein